MAGDRSDELTYWFCKMFLEHRRMHLGVGGYYFTDRVGEHLLVLTFTGFNKKFFENNTGSLSWPCRSYSMSCRASKY